jgi:hypothetical protein
MAPLGYSSRDLQGIARLPEGFLMDEASLITQWNKMRTQITFAQITPAFVLTGIFVLSTVGYFHTASMGSKYLAIGVAAATGITQYAAIREGQALLVDLKSVTKPSALGKKISESSSFLSLSALVIVGFDLGVSALILWAILGK